MTIDLKALAAPFPASKISWRVGSTNAKKMAPAKPTKGIGLAYIDARDVMKRLNDVCGAENWMCEYPVANGKTSCRISIRINGEWIYKENGAGDSQVEAEKGAFSDALKRAAVVWGIGMYLYDVENVWVDIDEWGQIKQSAFKDLEKSLQKAVTLNFGTVQDKALAAAMQPTTGEAAEMSQEDKATLVKEATEALGVVDSKTNIESWNSQYEEKLKKNISNYYCTKIFKERDDLLLTIEPRKAKA